MNSLVNTPVILLDTNIWCQYNENDKTSEISVLVNQIIDDMKSLKLRIGVNQTIFYELRNNKYKTVEFIESFINKKNQRHFCIDQENNFPLDKAAQFCQEHGVKLAVADAQIAITAHKNGWKVLTSDVGMHKACKKLEILYSNAYIDNVVIPGKIKKEMKDLEKQAQKRQEREKKQALIANQNNEPAKEK